MDELKIFPSEIELNFTPVGASEFPTQQSQIPQVNSPIGVQSAESNIVPSANGSVMNGGAMQSPNYSPGVSGWIIKAGGDVEFGSGKFRGDITGASGTFSGGIIAVTGSIGGWSISADAIYKDGLTDALSAGMAPVDYPFYAGKKYADRATAPFRVSPDGSLFASNATVSGAITAGVGSSIASAYLSGVIAQANLNVSNRGWTQTCAFSVTDADTVAWGSGVFTSADGTAYNIVAGNTGNMAAKTYIYLDTAVSATAFQTTTTATTAVGAGKVLVAIAQNGTGEATFKVMNGQGGENIDAANIVAGSITGNEIAASTITAGKLSVANLAAITADLGAITAGTITMPTTGYIKGGMTDYLTGTGFFLGYSGAAYKFSVGNPSGRYIAWDGTDLTVNGYLQSGKGAFGGDGSDGALSISSGTTTINLGNAAVVIKNYTSISITGTAKLAFSNPNTNGTVIILKSQGNVTITSSTNPAIDIRLMGGAGGAGAPGGGVGASGSSGSNGYNTINTAFGGTAGGAGSSGSGGPGGVANGLSPVIGFKIIKISVGAGGGGGSTENSNTSPGGAGGRGGGGLYIECGGALNITSTINASGEAGGDGSSYSGGGGGGAAGSIVIIYNTLTANSGTYTITAGAGGAAGNQSSGGGGGGGGGGITAGGNGGAVCGGGGAGGAGFSLVYQNNDFV